uniref:Amino acid transporter transmembrane domain-containing protein n=1 Tax=Aureoumbra lagunensis TaxID=44058 RepID=A0A7S3NFV1_9STRA|mmetsp:Transcript_17115/g.22196  ORF Transcript_17115/g.22196 Transcript_17115/m.22196 type:complete len:557 (+) Transcript_17115:44-1714(+)
MHTYCVGADDTDGLALRAREIGIRHRLAAQHRQAEGRFVAGPGMLMSTRLQIAALTGLGEDEEEEDEKERQWLSTRRMPSWLEEAVMARRGGEGSELQFEAMEAFDGRGDAIQSKLPGFTLSEAFLASVKACVGPAVLYMPKGFQEAGLVFGLVMLSISYCLFGYGSTRLLETWAKIRKSYAGMMGKAFGKKGVALIKLTIVLQQCGICMTYFVFVATNLRDVATALAPDGVHPPSLALMCFFQVLIYIPLVCVRDLQKFAHTNLLANALILYSLAVLLCFGLERVVAKPTVAKDRLVLFNSATFYLFVGTSAFVYEGSAALLVPLQEAVREDLQPYFAPLYLKTAGGIIATYIIFGLVNWAAYGDQTQTVLTVNLPDGAWKTSVQLAYLIAVIFTFPLQLFPAIQIFRSVINKLQQAHKKGGSSRLVPTHPPGGQPHPPPGYASVAAEPLSNQVNEEQQHAQDSANSLYILFKGNLARAILVLLLAAVSVLQVHSLDRLVALIGGLLGIPLAFIYPVAIHLKLVPEARFRYVNVLCIIIGLGLGLACTVVTMATW